MSRGKKHIPRKPPKQGDERTNSKLRRQFSEYEAETITLKAKIQRFSTAKLGVGVWKETVCVEDVCVLTHNLNWRRICQHIWLHFDKINNIDFLKEHGREGSVVLMRGTPEMYCYDPRGGKVREAKYSVEDVDVVSVGDVVFVGN